MKIFHISDSHGHDYNFTESADLLIHSGDLTNTGTIEQLHKYLESLSKYSHLFEKIIIIPGNHDFCFERKWDECKAVCDYYNITVLNDSGCEFKGYKIWGSPITPWFHDWAFNRFRGSHIKKHWDKIPADTEILITHGPSYKKLDRTQEGLYVGCEDLKKAISKLKSLKLHTYGHIHEMWGIKKVKNVIYSNGSIMNRRYQPVNKHNVIILDKK